MTIIEFINNYNFHDCRIYNLKFDEKEKIFCFYVDFNETLRGYFKDSEDKDKLSIKFEGVSNLKCVKDIDGIDDYLLNIWKTKGSKSGVEIILDDDNYTTIYFNAKNAVIQF